MAARFGTIGHSNRGISTFVEMLQAFGASLVADVRSFPRSRANAQYNIETLPERLAEHEIGYRHFPDLGGRRGNQDDVPFAANAWWRNRSFHNYADYAVSETFEAALAELEALGASQTVAIMCAEAVWWRCHRRIIADHLLTRGHRVVHLMAPARWESAALSGGAERREDGKLVYPATPAG